VEILKTILKENRVKFTSKDKKADLVRLVKDTVLKQSGTTEGTLSFIERFASLTRFVILT
jgi:hypothetical protein